MMPVPSGAGFSSTDRRRTAHNRVGHRGALHRHPDQRLLGRLDALLDRRGHFRALPTPKPTTPWPSPTTTSALKLRFLPPLTTLVTRLIETTVSLMSSWDGSIFSRVESLISRPRLELEPGLPSRLGHGADAPVVQEAVAVEHHTR
jgi:hypothetical protein